MSVSSVPVSTVDSVSSARTSSATVCCLNSARLTSATKKRLASSAAACRDSQVSQLTERTSSHRHRHEVMTSSLHLLLLQETTAPSMWTSVSLLRVGMEEAARTWSTLIDVCAQMASQVGRRLTSSCLLISQPSCSSGVLYFHCRGCFVVSVFPSEHRQVGPRTVLGSLQ